MDAPWCGSEPDLSSERFSSMASSPPEAWLPKAGSTLLWHRGGFSQHPADCSHGSSPSAAFSSPTYARSHNPQPGSCFRPKNKIIHALQIAH